MSTRAALTLPLLLLMPSVVATADAAEVGVVEDFNHGVGDWGGGADVVQNTTGGVGGEGDGWLHVSRLTAPGRLGVRSTSTTFIGNLTGAGVTGVHFWLIDAGPSDPLEIRVGVGDNRNNFWVTSVAFVPTAEWQPFEIGFNESDWVQTQGTGTFADALATSDRLLFRHDLEPITASPDSIVGDFGLDRVVLVPTPASTMLSMVGLALLAHRRRGAE